MSIYKPVSTASRRLSAFGSSLLGGIADGIMNGNRGAVSVNGTEFKAWRGVNKVLGGSALGRAASSLIGKGVNVATSEITRRLNAKTSELSRKLDDKISRLTRKGLKTFGMNAFDNERISREAVHFTGNMSIRDVWEMYKHTDVDSLSRKNFYILEVNDRSSAAPTSNGDRFSRFNLLATALSFTAFDIQGEAVPIGAVELDKPSASPRTVMNLTMLDDAYGTIKRWAEQKALMIAASDGTFLPPSHYVFDVRIVFGTNIADANYYEQIYTMRVQTMPHELSRTEQGLEEIQLTFVQSDTFMPHWI